MLRHAILPVTPFQQNCTLLWCDETAQAVLIDPGGEATRLLSWIGGFGIKITRILLTHGHLDHIGAAPEIAQTLSVPIEGPHVADAFWLEQIPAQCTYFGWPPVVAWLPGRWLEHGDRLSVGHEEIVALHCPGHTPGHLVYYAAKSRLAQVGDVLFNGSVGRTDLPRGNARELFTSIHKILLPLGDDIRFIPGHGPMSSFGHERRHNPFLHAPVQAV